jgi:hypothetical protein
VIFLIGELLLVGEFLLNMHEEQRRTIQIYNRVNNKYSYNQFAVQHLYFVQFLLPVTIAED